MFCFLQWLFTGVLYKGFIHDFFLRASIDEAEQLKIVEMNYNLHFMFSDVEVSGLRKRRIGQELDLPSNGKQEDELAVKEPWAAPSEEVVATEESVNHPDEGQLEPGPEPKSDIGNSEEDELLEGGSQTPARTSTPEAMELESNWNGDQ